VVSNEILLSSLRDYIAGRTPPEFDSLYLYLLVRESGLEDFVRVGPDCVRSLAVHPPVDPGHVNDWHAVVAITPVGNLLYVRGHLYWNGKVHAEMDPPWTDAMVPEVELIALELGCIVRPKPGGGP
jgi:hypothetical protein